MEKFLVFFKKPLVLLIVASILIGGFFIILRMNRTDVPQFEYIVAERNSLLQEVSVTGIIKPAESVDLAFEVGGRVARTYVDVGDRVGIGKTLVALESAETVAELAQAEARIESAKARLLQYEAARAKEQAKLAELKRGTRLEEIQTQEIKIANAKAALEDAKRNVVFKLQDAYTKSDDAVLNRVDQFFVNPRSATPLLSSDININFQLEQDIRYARLVLQEVFASWKFSLEQLTTSSDLISYISEAEINLRQVKAFLDLSASVVNGLTTTKDPNLSQATIDTWKADVSTGRTNINTAVMNLSTAEEKLNTEKSDLALAEQELVVKRAGSTEEQISAQEAQVQQSESDIASQKANIKEAEANFQYYQAQITKLVIRSPISGIVTVQDAKRGEIVTVNSTIVSLISEAQFQIESNITEVDISKIALGNKVRATLDAYGDEDIFEARVVTIDPAETVIEGVPTYKITLQFVENDERIKPGMTVNLDILTATLDDVIAIPQRAIISREGEKFVRVIEGDSFSEVRITTGLRGSSGTIEVTSGINEGDKVITFIKE